LVFERLRDMLDWKKGNGQWPRPRIHDLRHNADSWIMPTDVLLSQFFAALLDVTSIADAA